MFNVASWGFKSWWPGWLGAPEPLEGKDKVQVSHTPSSKGNTGGSGEKPGALGGWVAEGGRVLSAGASPRRGSGGRGGCGFPAAGGEGSQA